MSKKQIAQENIETIDGAVEDFTALTPEQQEQRQVRRAEIMVQFGDGKDYNRDRIEGEIVTYAEQYKKSVFEAGKRLTLLKEHEGHGGFLKCLDRLDIDERTARNMMAVARVFLDETGNPNRKSISDLPPTKLYALASLDDETLDEFEEGSIDGFTPEEAQKMSSRDFKKKIQELKNQNKQLEDRYRQDMEIKDQLLSDKNRKIDELDGQVRVMTDPSRWGEKAENYLTRLQSIIPHHYRMIGELAEIITGIQEVSVKDWELSQNIVLEQAKYTFQKMSEDLDRIENMLTWAAPEGNAVYHHLNQLRAVRNVSPAEAE